MNDLDFSFEQSPWEAFLMTKGMGDTVSAVSMLSMLEDVDEQQLEDALSDLETGCMILDISGLPKVGGTGEAALRLRREMQLVRTGLRPEDLEEQDPLRLYLEEVAAMPAFGEEALLAQRCANGEERAMEQLDKLRGCEVHSTVILSEVDERTFKRLGVNLTCEPRFKV